MKLCGCNGECKKSKCEFSRTIKSQKNEKTIKCTIVSSYVNDTGETVYEIKNTRNSSEFFLYLGEKDKLVDENNEEFEVISTFFTKREFGFNNTVTLVYIEETKEETVCGISLIIDKLIEV
jgi:hypothetical protein